MASVPLSLRVLFCAVLAAAAAGCGGGGGGGDVPAPPPAPTPVPPPPPPPPGPPPAPAPGAAASAQGFWSGQANAQTFVSSVILAEGPVMQVSQTAGLTTLVIGTVNSQDASFSITGRSYNLNTGVQSGYAASGTVVPKATLAFAPAGGAAGYTLAYSSAYETPANLADVTGRWRTSFAGGTLVLTLDVASSGAITGSNTSGCNYSGSLAPHAGGVAVYDLRLTEACPNVAAVQFTGIATLYANKTILSAGFASNDLTTANAFQATR